LAWAYQKQNMILKEREKGFLKILSGKGKAHFSAKKCCVKRAEKEMPREQRQKRGNYADYCQ
jgi:hypothetical protein